MELVDEARDVIKYIQFCETKQKTAIDWLQDLRNTLSDHHERHLVAKEGLAVIQDVAQSIQTKLETQITTLVNMAILAVFDDAPKFKMEIVVRRNKTECDLLFVEGNNKDKPVDSSGGGLLDVVSFALRVVVLSFTNLDRVLIIDEPFKFLSVNKSNKVAHMLAEISKTLGVQIIMVSHMEDINITADTTYEVSLKNKIAHVVEVQTIN